MNLSRSFKIYYKSIHFSSKIVFVLIELEIWNAPKFERHRLLFTMVRKYTCRILFYGLSISADPTHQPVAISKMRRSTVHVLGIVSHRKFWSLLRKKDFLCVFRFVLPINCQFEQALLKLLGVKIVVSGDHIRPNDSAVLIMNHRTRVDWNFLWGAMYQACMPRVVAHNLKMILKDPIRHVPGPGLNTTFFISNFGNHLISMKQIITY